VSKTRKLPNVVLLILSLALVCVCATAAPAFARAARHAGGRHVHNVRKHPRRAASRTHVRKNTPVRTHAVAPHKRTVPKAERPNRPSSKRSEAANEAAAKISTVLATPCENTELTPTESDLPQVRSSVLCLINRTRAEHGLAPLVENSALESAAESHCSELIAVDYFAHVAPDGETPVDRIRKAGYIPGPEVGYVIGENLAWGTYNLSTAASIVAAWIASPGHLANILESRYTETGVAITPAVPQSLGEGSPGATYAQEFGVIVH
jgi:uncharacterized protein YkwD